MSERTIPVLVASLLAGLSSTGLRTGVCFTKGAPYKTYDPALGGWIAIHGAGGRRYDWTKGSIAVGDEAMDHLFDLRAGVGTTVAIARARE